MCPPERNPNAAAPIRTPQNVLFFIKNVKCNVFILSYRGYGESEGKPSESGIKQDAQAALDHLLQRKCVHVPAGRGLVARHANADLAEPCTRDGTGTSTRASWWCLGGR